jgi:sec-independent protein translocase protein TatC
VHEALNDDSPLRIFLTGVERARKLTVWTLLALIAGTTVSWAYAREIYGIIALPLTRELALRGQDSRLVFTGLSDPFILYFTLSLLGGVVIATPVLSAQIYVMVAARVRARSSIAMAAFALAGTVLFLGGMAFCYFILLPFAIAYLLDIAGQFETAITVRDFLRFSTRLLVAMGVAAQLPLVSMVAARVGLVTARTLWSWLPYAVVGSFILAAWITPPDGMSQLLVAIPLLVLYLVGIGLAAIVGR